MTRIECGGDQNQSVRVNSLLKTVSVHKFEYRCLSDLMIKKTINCLKCAKKKTTSGLLNENDPIMATKWRRIVLSWKSWLNYPLLSTYKNILELQEFLNGTSNADNVVWNV